MKEIRVKYDDSISDELASQLVRSVINQGKKNDRLTSPYGTIAQMIFDKKNKLL